MENIWHIESTLKKILGIITIILREKKRVAIKGLCK